MTTRSPSRILAFVLRRRPAPARNPHRFYPIDTQSCATSNPQEAPHD
jgi:hypothetical protein